MANPAMPARPTSDALFALADIITAPSTPKKQKRVIIMVAFICSPKDSAEKPALRTSALNTSVLKSMIKLMMMNMSMATFTTARRVLTIFAVLMPRATM